MRLRKYIIVAVCITVGILLCTTGDQLLISIGFILISVQGLFWGADTELLKPLRLQKPEWKPKQYLTSAIIILCMALFMIVLTQLPAGQAEALFTNWYFAGTLWLLAMALLAKRYVEEREKSRQTQ